MARKPALVTQHLEGVSRELLEEHQEIVRRYVRARNGVYALYRGKRLYYVGLATNLKNRLGHHLKDRHHGSWDRFSGWTFLHYQRSPGDWVPLDTLRK